MKKFAIVAAGAALPPAAAGLWIGWLIEEGAAREIRLAVLAAAVAATIAVYMALDRGGRNAAPSMGVYTGALLLCGGTIWLEAVRPAAAMGIGRFFEGLLALDTLGSLLVAGSVAAAIPTGLVWSDMAGRLLARNRGRSKKRSASEVFGKAKLLEDEYMRRLARGQGVLLGQTGTSGDAPLIAWPLEGSAITFAPPRTGKGATIALNYLAPGGRGWPGSTVLIDPRGETWCIVARRRREMGRRPVLIDPFGVVSLHGRANGKESAGANGQAEGQAKSNGNANGHANANGDAPVDVEKDLHLPAVRSRCYNPMDFIRADPALAPRDINVLLDALLTPPGGGNDTSTHFYESARAIIAGFVAWVRFSDGFRERNLQQVHRLLTLPAQDRKKVVEAMRTAKGPGADLVRVAAERQLQVGEQEAGSNFSTIANQLSFLNYPELEANTRRSDFDPMELAKGDVDLFIVVPEEMTEHARSWLRLWITIPNAVSSMTPLERDMLIIVDEMPRVGYLKPVMDGYNLAAGRGVHFWCFAQSVSALDKTWGPDSRQVLVELAEVLQILGFPRTDVAGADTLSRAIGVAGFENWSESYQGQAPPAAMLPQGDQLRTSDSVAVTKERVVTPDEIMTMGPEDQFVIAAPKDMPRDAFALNHARYWTRPDARLLADPNPFVLRKRSAASGSRFAMYGVPEGTAGVKPDRTGDGDERGQGQAGSGEHGNGADSGGGSSAPGVPAVGAAGAPGGRDSRPPGGAGAGLVGRF
ncbi:MAG: type IV secretory system conjugative DNA transfer family protein [Defluviicoccus sp.]|nr:type IV secretory system conjugative DNA transfer family protein [Defluviicoccus sp.]MDE0277018.1 type IV secretory system conjugative DNA transfer family protein [Defluviicoccus sp.]